MRQNSGLRPAGHEPEREESGDHGAEGDGLEERNHVEDKQSSRFASKLEGRGNAESSNADDISAALLLTCNKKSTLKMQSSSAVTTISHSNDFTFPRRVLNIC